MIGQNSLSKTFFTVSSLLKWSCAGDPNVFHDEGLCEFPPPKRLSLLPFSRSFPVLSVGVGVVCDLCCLGSWVIVCAAIEQNLLRESFPTVGHTLGSLSQFFFLDQSVLHKKQLAEMHVDLDNKRKTDLKTHDDLQYLQTKATEF